MASSHQTGPILQHWNDVPPDFTPSAPSSRSATPGTGAPPATSSSAPSPSPFALSAHLNTKYSNSSTLSLAVHLGSRAGSRSNSVVGLRAGGGGGGGGGAGGGGGGGGGGGDVGEMTARYVRELGGVAGFEDMAVPRKPPPEAEEDEEDEDEDEGADEDALPPLLDALLALPSALSPAEYALARDRLLGASPPPVGEPQVVELVGVLREVIAGRQDGATWGRAMIVGFLKEWVGRGVDVDVRWLGTLRRVVESLGEGEGERAGRGVV
ncbi:MAG: hypothetical protein M1839_008002 [Geoglossum umbratile]|nr:MAG: hypothetical protein M1839_008002 [Geoglossum umbratile]